jgi:pSer/pThr/pTyr-binding forkhead associated (FHA) protein
MVTDSMLGAESLGDEESFSDDGKTSVSVPDTTPEPPAKTRPTAPTHRTNPNPPTPEQKPRSGNVAVGNVAVGDVAVGDVAVGDVAVTPTPSPDVQVEGTLLEDSDTGDDDFHSDDFHSEATEVFDSPYESEALVARLAVLGGPAAGQEFLLNKQRNTIGRGKKNTITLSDLAMSRQHLEILEQNDQTYLLVDLQAANGTRLNSSRIEEAELIHGDRIEAGKSELQFVIPGDRPQHSPETQRRSKNRHIVHKRESTTTQGHTMVRQVSGQGVDDETTDKVLTYIIIGAGVLSLLLIGAATYLYVNNGPPPEPTTQPVAAEDPEAQALYLEAVEEVKDRQWNDARQIFEQVGQADPDFAGVAAQLERVSREKRAQGTLEDAASLFEQDQIDEAAEVAGKISNQSVYFDDAQDLLRKTRQRRIDQLYQKAQEAVTAEDLEQAQTHLAVILEDVPNHKGALELRQTITKADGQDDQDEQTEREEPESTSNDDWLASSGSRSSRPSSGGSTTVNFTRGFTLYKSGKFDQATAHFDDAASRSSGAVARRATKTAKAIKRFEKSYARASRAFDAGAWRTAVDGLEDASRADRSVARSRYFRSEINTKLASAYGKIGLDDFAKGNFASANRSYTKGSKYQRSNSTINSLRRKLSNQARRLYIQVANKRKTDPAAAKKLCRQIMAMVPSSHSMHQKAAKVLQEL